jgi:hypothetical protein
VFIPDESTVESLTKHLNKPTFWTALYLSPATLSTPPPPPPTTPSLFSLPSRSPSTERSTDFLQSSQSRLLNATNVQFIYNYLAALQLPVGRSAAAQRLLLPEDSLAYSSQCISSARGLRSNSSQLQTKVACSLLKDIHEVIPQCASVAKDCGVYCGLLALDFSLEDLMSSIRMYMAMSRIGQRGNLSNFDEKRFNEVTDGVSTSEFMTNGRQQEIFNPHLAVTLSLFEFFVALTLPLPRETVNTVVEKYETSLSTPLYHWMRWLSRNRPCSLAAEYFNGERLRLKAGDNLASEAEFLFEGNRIEMDSFIVTMQRIVKDLIGATPLNELLPYISDNATDCLRTEEALSLKSFKSDQPDLVKLSNEMMKYYNDEASRHDSHPRKGGKEAIFSDKLISLLKIWQFFCGRNESMSTIIFCYMKLTVRSVDKVLQSLNSISEKGPRRLSLRSGAIYGDMSNCEQNKILKAMKDQEINVLVATDIAEEGLDIKSCQLVINFDSPSTAKSFIQRRGRARAEEPSMVSLISRGTESGQKLLDDLVTYIDDAEKLYKTTDELWRELRDLRMDDATSAKFDPMSGHVYRVESTGATADITSAVTLLHQYCTRLAVDHYHISKPYFAFQTVESKYRCSLLLPSNAPPSTRCTATGLHSSKKVAKGLAAIG